MKPGNVLNFFYEVLRAEAEAQGFDMLAASPDERHAFIASVAEKYLPDMVATGEIDRDDLRPFAPGGGDKFFQDVVRSVVERGEIEPVGNGQYRSLRAGSTADELIAAELRSRFG